MRRWLWVLWFACGVAMGSPDQAQAQPLPPGPGAPAPSGPGGPGPGGHTFDLLMCNKASNEVGDIYVAVAGATRRSTGQTVIRVNGWWKLPTTQCVNLGEFQRPGV